MADPVDELMGFKFDRLRLAAVFFFFSIIANVGESIVDELIKHIKEGPEILLSGLIVSLLWLREDWFAPSPTTALAFIFLFLFLVFRAISFRYSWLNRLWFNHFTSASIDPYLELSKRSEQPEVRLVLCCRNVTPINNYILELKVEKVSVPPHITFGAEVRSLEDQTSRVFRISAGEGGKAEPATDIKPAVLSIPVTKPLKTARGKQSTPPVSARIFVQGRMVFRGYLWEA